MTFGFPVRTVAQRVLCLTLLSSFLLLTFLRAAYAHEVQPAVADVSSSGNQVEIAIAWSIEAPIAGLDLQGVANTNDAEGSDDYDALRALDPVSLEAAFRGAWPEIAGKLTAVLQGTGEADGTPLDLQIAEIEIPDAGDVELPRLSTIVLSADVVPHDEGLVFGWDASFGPLVVRQVDVDDGYATFLENGRLSAPIALTGGTDLTASEALVEYIGVGFDHIIPLGLDHILFVLGLFFLASRMGPLLWQVTAFTLAHTVTLALGALGVVNLPGNIVEPLIAASIVYVGIENVMTRELTPWRPVVVFVFGLLHGLGFASVLQDFGLGSSHFIPKLIGFNIGVEIGQLAVIAAAFIALGWLFSKHGWYKTRIANPVSIAIAVIAAFWVLERTGSISADGVWGPMAALTEGGMPVLWGAGVALIVMLAMTIAVFATDSDVVRDWGGFATSFVAFTVVTGAFTALDYTIMGVVVVAWVVTIRLQSVGGLDGDPSTPY